jgi:hypothetical protein
MLSELVRFGLPSVAAMAGISVLRNPIKVWPNTLAGLTYLMSAAASLLLGAWWPLIAGWVISLALQGLCMSMMARGAFDGVINAQRAKKGLPPLSGASP